MFIFAGAFDQLGKDQQQHKPTSFSSQKKDGKSKAANNSKDDAKHKEDSTSNKVYKDIKPLLIGDSVMVDIGEYFTVVKKSLLVCVVVDPSLIDQMHLQI